MEASGIPEDQLHDAIARLNLQSQSRHGNQEHVYEDPSENFARKSEIDLSWKAFPVATSFRRELD